MSFLIFFNQNKIATQYCNLTFNIGENVTIKYNGATLSNGEAIRIKKGSDFEAEITVSEGYNLSVTGATLNGNKISIHAVSEDTTIIAAAEIKQYPVEITTNSMVSVTTNYGNVGKNETKIFKVNHGESFTATITRDENTNPVDSYGNSITIPSVTQAYSYNLASLLKIYNVIVKTDQYSTVSYNNNTIDKNSQKTFSVEHGTTFNATITRDSHYIPNDEYSNNIINFVVTDNKEITVQSKLETKIVKINLDANTLFRHGTVDYAPGKAHEIAVNYGEEFFGTFTPTEGYELDYSASDSRIKDGNIQFIVTDNDSVTVISKRKTVYHQVNIHAANSGFTLKYGDDTGSYGSYDTTVSGTVEDGKDFGPVEIIFTDGYEIDSYSGAEMVDGKLYVRNVTKQTDIDITAKESYVEPKTYSITINKSGDAANEITYNGPTTFNEGHSGAIMLDVPIGYEITSVSNNAGLTINKTELEKEGLKVGRLNHAAFSGAFPSQDIEITVSAQPATFNIKYNIGQSCNNNTSWINIDSIVTTYKSGRSATSINLSGLTEQWFKIGSASVDYYGNDTNYSAKISNLKSEGSRTGNSVFSMQITPGANPAYIVGDITINITPIGVSEYYEWNLGSGALGAIYGRYGNPGSPDVNTTQNGKGTWTYDCTTSNGALTVFVHKDYKVNGWSIANNGVTDNSLGSFVRYLNIGESEDSIPTGLSDWKNAANDGYTSVWSFDKYVHKDLVFNLTTLKRTKYDATISGSDMTYELLEKQWDGSWAPITGTTQVLREYVEHNENGVNYGSYGLYDGIYKIRLNANQFTAFESATATVGGTQITLTPSEPVTHKDWNRYKAYESDEFKATGNLVVIANTIPWALQDVNLTIINDTNSEKVLVDMMSDANAMRVLKSSEYDNEAPRINLYFNNELATEETGGLITIGSSATFDFSMTTPYEYSAQVEEGINDSGFTHLALQPNLDPGILYSVRAKLIGENETWSNLSKPASSGERAIIALPHEFSLNNSDFKIDIEITLYSEDKYNSYDKLSVVDNTGAMVYNTNKWVWQRGSLTDATEDTQLILNYNRINNDVQSNIKVQVYSKINEGEDDVILRSYIWNFTKEDITTLGTYNSPLILPLDANTDKIANIEVTFDYV